MTPARAAVKETNQTPTPRLTNLLPKPQSGLKRKPSDFLALIRHSQFVLTSHSFEEKGYFPFYDKNGRNFELRSKQACDPLNIQ